MSDTRHPRTSWRQVFCLLLAVTLLAACGRARPPANPEEPGLYAPTLSVVEGSSGQGVTQVDLAVTLKPARQDTITVNYRLVDGSATFDSDYRATQREGTLTFAPGETRKTVRVEILDDALYEGLSEDFSLVLSGAQGANIVTGTGVITITDDDRRPFASIHTDPSNDAVREVSVPESETGGAFRRVQVRVRLDIPSGLSTEVPVNTNGEASATPQADYRLLDGAGEPLPLPIRFTFAPGETEKTFTVEIIDDGAVEGDEVVVLGVTDDVSGALRYPNLDIGRILIEDDDRPDYAAVSTSPRRRLNDTGVLRYAYHLQWNDGSEADDHSWEQPYETLADVQARQPSTSLVGVSFYDGQDALYGRDAEAVAASGDKNAAGFRFTKLGPDGTPLADQNADYQDTPWHCVKDEITGLVWEVKTADAGLHGESTDFTWYDVDSAANGGSPGQPGYFDCASGCSAGAFVAQANVERWCGMTGWRLPTLEELRSIADYGADHNRLDQAARACGSTLDKNGNPVTVYCKPAPLDRFYFPNYNPTLPYWSSTPVVGEIGQVWGMKFFGLPTDEPLNKGDTALVRLVRDAD